jgi:hypothetical protein
MRGPRGRRGVVRIIVGVLVLIVFLYGPLTLINVYALRPDPPAVPTCSGEVMQPGDTCRVSISDSNGTSVAYYTYQQVLQSARNDYESSVSSDKIAGWILVGVDAVFIAFILVRRRIRRALPQPV